ASEVIADIGHNPPALRLNFAQLRAMMASGAYDRLVILYGIMADKALDDILPLFPGLDPADCFEVRYIFTTPSTARALPGEEILARFDRFLRSARNDRCSNGSGMTESDRCPSRSGMTNVSAEAVEPVADAVRAALAAATPRSLVYMGGSTFLVADVLRVANDLE
ncbi:MAG: hypothetical protein J6T07_00745, partial [Bacteroidales bacterium]|nr:hypothetical protein [Bacteroidales bacterium]